MTGGHGDIGGRRWAAVGSIHRIPVAGVPGSLCLCGLEVIGPDPDAVVDHVGAEVVVCLQTDAEIERRHPAYLAWLARPPVGVQVRRVAIEDHLVAPDDEMVELVGGVCGDLDRGRTVLVHCGAGWGRAGTLAALVMVACGSDVARALTDLRAARPAAGPQSVEQARQVSRLAVTVRRLRRRHGGG